MSSECVTRAQAFWLLHPLCYLVPLKYTHLYADVMVCACDEAGDSFGALLHYATADVFWDLGMYPNSDRIVIPTASDEAAAVRLCHRLQEQFAGQKLIFKFSEPRTYEIFAAAFSLTHARTLISYTAPQAIHQGDSNPVWASDPAVSCTTAPDKAVLALYRANGYTDDELSHMFSQGALSFALHESDEVACVCMAFQNFGSIWEIGGVQTRPEMRRRGYAQRVVTSALAVLMDRALTPRYLVDSTNTPSVHLAESLGLAVALRFEHYVAQAPY